VLTASVTAIILESDSCKTEENDMTTTTEFQIWYKLNTATMDAEMQKRFLKPDGTEPEFLMVSALESLQDAHTVLEQERMTGYIYWIKELRRKPPILGELKMINWIAMTDRLPDVEGRYLISDQGNHVEMGIYVESAQKFRPTWAKDGWFAVTHWAEVPKGAQGVAA